MEYHKIKILVYIRPFELYGQMIVPSRTLPKRMYYERETGISTIKTKILKLLLVLLNINC